MEMVVINKIFFFDSEFIIFNLLNYFFVLLLLLYCFNVYSTYDQIVSEVVKIILFLQKFHRLKLLI